MFFFNIWIFELSYKKSLNNQNKIILYIYISILGNMNLENRKSLLGFFLESENSFFTMKKNAKKYYFVIASKKFLLKEEPLEEVLRERFQYCLRESKYMNFWLIQSPQFLETPIMNKLKNKIPSEFTAIISTNEPFVRWLKLRYHHVGIGSFFAPSKFVDNPFFTISSKCS